MARRLRIQNALNTLSAGGRVIDAQIEAGFESPSAFRVAFAKLLGLPPGAFCNNARLQADWIDTPLGAMIAVSDHRQLHLLEFFDRKALPGELRKLHVMVRGGIGFGRPPTTQQTATQLKAYFSGNSAVFSVPRALHGSPFTRSVRAALQDIPAGQTRSYSQIAAATGSWGVASAQGYTDGEAMPLDQVLAILQRITASTDLPVTLDFEVGYTHDLASLAENIARMIATGAIGINFGDRVIGGTGLVPLPDQCARIAAIRARSDQDDLPLFINARTDLFFQGSAPQDHADLLPQAIERTRAYAQAGASGVFVPGLQDPDLIGTLCDRATLRQYSGRGGLALISPACPPAASPGSAMGRGLIGRRCNP